MFNQITYNVLIDRLKAFADGHLLINSFTHGSLAKMVEQLNESSYPLMHVTPSLVSYNVGERSFQMDIVFADLPRMIEEREEYEREVISDMIQIGEDLIAEIRNGGVIFGQDVTLDDGVQFSPFIADYTHTISGISLSITLTFPYNWNACDIPADWSTGGASSGSSAQGYGLLLKTNNQANAVQDILNLVDGSNITIEDLGDGRVRINSEGGISSVAWGDIVGSISNQIDLQNALDLKADISSLADVAFSGDYGDLINTPTIPPAQVNADWNATSGVEEILNKPTIPDSSTFVPYTGATSNVNLGSNSFIADDGSDNSEMSPTLFGVQNTAGTKYSYLDKSGLNVTDGGDTMNVNAGQITFPDATSQYSAAVNADWNAVSGLAEILNKPTIPAAQIQSDWTQANTSALDFIKNKPTLPATIGDMTKAVYDTDADGVVDSAERIEIIVRNSTGSTLTKGQVVYLSGATGNRPNALLADASLESTSSKTIGLVVANIANNADGSVAVNGTLHDLDTSAFNAGDILWLSETAGAVQANTPPAEPAHAVFIGYVARSHPNLGRIALAIQNGCELDELHGVKIDTPLAKNLLSYNSASTLWENKAIDSTWMSDRTSVGGALIGLSNPSAIRYLRVNADNSVSALTASQLRSDLGFIAQIQSTQLTNSSSSVEVNISGCSVSLEANSTYIGRLTIASGSVPVLGFILTFTFPAGATMSIGRTNSGASTSAQIMQWQSVTSATALSPLFGTAQNQAGYSDIQIHIATGGTAGTLTPSFRSGTNGSAITIYAGLTSIQLQKL